MVMIFHALRLVVVVAINEIKDAKELIMALRKSLSWRIQKVYVEFGHVKPFLMMAYKRQARILIHYKKISRIWSSLVYHGARWIVLGFQILISL